MKNYQAIVTEKTAHNFGQVIANTKSPGQYKGMTLEQFTEATSAITVFTITIFEL